MDECPDKTTYLKVRCKQCGRTFMTPLLTFVDGVECKSSDRTVFYSPPVNNWCTCTPCDVAYSIEQTNKGE